MDNLHTNTAYGASSGRTLFNGHAVSWGAILSGASVMLATSAILLTLGSGLGLSLGGHEDATAMKIGVGAVIWIIVVQWLSSFVGGYVSGRLRNRWEGLHGDEVFFRDSAHGLVAWSVAAVFGTIVVFSAVTSLASAGAQAVGSMAASVAGNERLADAAGNSADDALTYYVDSAFRTEGRTSVLADDRIRDEAAEVLVRGMASPDGISGDDKAYLANLISRSTSLDADEASARVDDAVAKIQEDKDKAAQAADEARKSAATLSILTALAMVIGAFIASVSAIMGGRDRDLF